MGDLRTLSGGGHGKQISERAKNSPHLPKRRLASVQPSPLLGRPQIGRPRMAHQFNVECQAPQLYPRYHHPSRPKFLHKLTESQPCLKKV